MAVEKMYDIKTAAAMLGFSEKSMEYYVKKVHKVPAVVVGRKYMILESTLEKINREGLPETVRNPERLKQARQENIKKALEKKNEEQ